MARIDDLMSMGEDELSDLVHAHKQSEAEQMYLEGADGNIFEIKEAEAYAINDGGQAEQVEWLLSYENN